MSKGIEFNVVKVDWVIHKIYFTLSSHGMPHLNVLHSLTYVLWGIITFTIKEWRWITKCNQLHTITFTRDWIPTDDPQWWVIHKNVTCLYPHKDAIVPSNTGSNPIPFTIPCQQWVNRIEFLQGKVSTQQLYTVGLWNQWDGSICCFTL